MSDAIDDFQRECADAGVTPEAALVAAGLHRATWFRWKSGSVSPTLRSLQSARDAIPVAASQKADGVATLSPPHVERLTEPDEAAEPLLDAQEGRRADRRRVLAAVAGGSR